MSRRAPSLRVLADDDLTFPKIHLLQDQLSAFLPQRRSRFMCTDTGRQKGSTRYIHSNKYYTDDDTFHSNFLDIHVVYSFSFYAAQMFLHKHFRCPCPKQKPIVMLVRMFASSYENFPYCAPSSRASSSNYHASVNQPK